MAAGGLGLIALLLPSLDLALDDLTALHPFGKALPSQN
jgi:hypothetical protein